MAFDAAGAGLVDLVVGGGGEAAAAGAADIGAGVAAGVGADVAGGLTAADIAGGITAAAGPAADLATMAGGGLTAGLSSAATPTFLGTTGAAGESLGTLASGATAGTFGGVAGPTAAVGDDITALSAGNPTGSFYPANVNLSGAPTPSTMTGTGVTGNLGAAPGPPPASGITMPSLQQVGTGLGIMSAGYGLYTAEQMRQLAKQQAQLADPFGPSRAGYAQQLNALMQNPSSVTGLPGYQFGLTQGEQGVSRLAAQQGLNLTPAEALAIQQFDQQYAGQQFQTQEQNLATLAGANISPVGGATALGGATNAALLSGASLGTLGSLAGRNYAYNNPLALAA